MKERIALFPGSFDPITLGHKDIIVRALPLFDKIIIGLGGNTNKKYMFPLGKRKKWIEDTFKNQEKVIVKPYSGLTVDFALKENANFMLRGLRNPADFEFEKAIAHMNRELSGKLEVVFLLTSSGNSYISSSNVRDVIRNNGDYTLFVPSSVRI